MTTKFETLTIQQFADMVMDEYDAMTNLLRSKRESYGPSNLTRFGTLGILIRASDKVERLSTLLQSGETTSADGDSIEDAWKDLLGYATLALVYMRCQDVEWEEVQS